MNCCDDFGRCTRGPNCPARASLHDLSNTEAIDGFKASLDMSEIARIAALPKQRHWALEYKCNGLPFMARQDGNNEAAADNAARQRLASEYHAFQPADAVLVACVEV